MSQSPPTHQPVLSSPASDVAAESIDAFTPAQPRMPDWVSKRPWLYRLLVAITGVSISAKIMGIVLALTILFGLTMIIQVRLIMVNALQNELHNNGLGLGRDLAGHAAPLVVADDKAAIDNLLAVTLQNHPDSRYAFVLDNERQVVASASRAANGEITNNVAIPPQIMETNLAAATDQISHLHYDSPEGRIHAFVIPILAAPTEIISGAGAATENEVGLVRLGLIETRLNGLIQSASDQLWLTTLIVAGVGILAAMLLTWLLTRPILDLVTTTEQLRQGNLRVRAPHWNDDEIGALADAFNRMVSDLEQTQQTVIAKENARTHLLSRLISAQEEERKRIARELHDGVGQALTSILVHIKVLAQNQDAATQARMAELHKLLDETLTGVRMLSRELRPSALDDLGLAAALERYMKEFGVRYPHLQTDLQYNMAHRLPPSVETSLYRIIQEAMTNSARHSEATSLSVIVHERGGMVLAIIEDNGRGFDVENIRRAGSSVGLHSMTERSELLDGTLNVESGSDGTTVYVEIPLAQTGV